MIGRMPKSDAQRRPPTAAADEPREGPSAATRDRILDAAALLVGERGWDAVTTRSVAERAGVNQALIHYHFGSMEVLLREAVLGAMTRELELAVAPLFGAVPIADGLRSLGREMATIDPTSPRGVLFIEALLRTARDPAMNEAMAAELQAFRRQFAERLASEAAQGRVRTDIPMVALSAALTAALDGLLLHRIADPTTDLSSAVEALIRSLEPVHGTGRT